MQQLDQHVQARFKGINQDRNGHSGANNTKNYQDNLIRTPLKINCVLSACATYPPFNRIQKWKYTLMNHEKNTFDQWYIKESIKPDEHKYEVTCKLYPVYRHTGHHSSAVDVQQIHTMKFSQCLHEEVHNWANTSISQFLSLSSAHFIHCQVEMTDI